MNYCHARIFGIVDCDKIRNFVLMKQTNAKVENMSHLTIVDNLDIKESETLLEWCIANDYKVMFSKKEFKQ